MNTHTVHLLTPSALKLDEQIVKSLQCKRKTQTAIYIVNVLTKFTLDAAYKVYMGQGILAMPEDTFKMTPLPLRKRIQSVCVRKLIMREHYEKIIQQRGSNLSCIPGSTILHILKENMLFKALP